MNRRKALKYLLGVGTIGVIPSVSLAQESKEAYKKEFEERSLVCRHYIKLFRKVLKPYRGKEQSEELWDSIWTDFNLELEKYPNVKYAIVSGDYEFNKNADQTKDIRLGYSFNYEFQLPNSKIYCGNVTQKGIAWHIKSFDHFA